MSDLVKKSRTCAERVRKSKFPDHHAALWLDRQSDEIERLQARVDELEGMEHKYGDEYFTLKEALANREHDPESMGCPKCGGQFDSITRLCIECGCPVDSEESQ